jgi:creatinine amidohydrolase
MLLGELTWPEAQGHAQRGSVVIIPTGSTEQHGPHLPLHTDIHCAFEIAMRVADRSGCLVAPPLPFG